MQIIDNDATKHNIHYLDDPAIIFSRKVSKHDAQHANLKRQNWVQKTFTYPKRNTKQTFSKAKCLSNV